MKMGCLFLGLLLCVSGDVMCMKRNELSSDREEQGDTQRRRYMLYMDLSEDEDTKESDSDSKESSDLQSRAATAMERDSEGEDACLFDEAAFEGLETQLHDAIFDRNDARVQTLLEKGANVLARDPFNDGDTALHCAMRVDFQDTITQQLLEAMADVEARNDDLLTPLLVAAEVTNMSGIRLLIAAKADPKAVVTETGETILHMLVKRPCGVECLREMVCHYGMDMKVRDLTGCTAAFSALNLGHHKEAFYLARMKYIMERVYNRLYVKRNRDKVMPQVDFSLMSSSSSPFPQPLSHLIVDYLFFVEDNKKSVEEVAEEAGDVVGDQAAATE